MTLFFIFSRVSLPGYVWIALSWTSLMAQEVILPAEVVMKDETSEEAVTIGRADEEKVGILPADTGALAREGAEAFANGDWEGARKAYAELVEAVPDNALAHVNLGTVEHRSGDLEAAVRHLTKATELNPHLAQAWTLLGLIYFEEEEVNMAISCLTRALHEDPLDAKTHNYLGVVIKSIGWIIGAEDSLSRAIELDPNYASAHFNLALMHLDRTPPARELARRHYEKALSLGAKPDEIMEERLEDGE